MAGTIDITSAEADDRDTDRAIDACPTEAIYRGVDGNLRLDRGRCILCGRCPLIAPHTFTWRYGSDVAGFTRRSIVVGEHVETEETLREVRADLAARVRRLRRSVHLRHIDTGSDGSDEWEVQALTNPVYDLHRLGLFFTASPRHADILLVTGLGAHGMTAALRATFDAMPDPIVVIATGVDAISGGIVGTGYAVSGGIGGLLDVDVWVPGSPASPFAILHGILLALDRLPDRTETRR
ncbi:NADH:ubiquinone oxidoreductase [Streptomyces sp. L7]|uniref:NADH-quinone oxidoreductase subunit B family protein n=1 Tax=Streptomyces sp. L7 TaxID=3423954 RepID=UPI003D9671B3